MNKNGSIALIPGSNCAGGKGRVGINQTNPSYDLHVVGNGYFSSSLMAYKLAAGKFDDTYNLNVYAKTGIPQIKFCNDNSALIIGIATANGHFAATAKPRDVVFKTQTGDGNPNNMMFYINNNDNDGNSYIEFGDNYNYAVMRIYNNANVKIDGYLFAKSLRLNTNVWSDDVFNKNYKLMPLNELEVYIKNNKHLPGFPNQEKVKKEGINVAEMDAMLLRKIEELTLYVIELKKENEKLQLQLNKINSNK